MHSFSLLICTRDRAPFLRDTLASIARLDVPDGMTGEVIVVDNASTDETAEVVRAASHPTLPVRYVREPRPGVARARNTAIVAATGELLLWTDDDVRLPHNWISVMSALLLRGDADGVTGKIRLAPHLERPWMTRSHYDRLTDTRYLPEDFGVMTGVCMGFHRRVLNHVPGFDPEIGPGGRVGFLEEALLSFQLREAGFRLKALPHLTIEHHPDPSRLLRRSWLKNGDDHGRSEAYVQYHWAHEPVRWPRARRAFWGLALQGFRLARRPPSPDAEGCHRYEIRLVQKRAFYDQYLIERRLPRRYDRRGLTKRAGELSPLQRAPATPPGSA